MNYFFLMSGIRAHHLGSDSKDIMGFYILHSDLMAASR